ncbi:hypothetical protein F511_27122 [Dorcoceras hygrometricum]|uniref:Uncharacterized protein n=1 Tax=Dorcoceras hygrometricum TaxID=472368 RepID=A0A2Z7CMT2_9LAMI|nr:hypothetical protein F511_27122 [Dorcoceras hygrometricum]
MSTEGEEKKLNQRVKEKSNQSIAYREEKSRNLINRRSLIGVKIRGIWIHMRREGKIRRRCEEQSRIPLVRTSSESTVRRPGKAPEGAVPSPSPGRHAVTRSRRASSSSSSPTADGFGTGTPVPSPQSQSFSRGYGSILPTSLAYIVPSTRGCSPWRPDASAETKISLTKKTESSPAPKQILFLFFNLFFILIWVEK